MPGKSSFRKRSATLVLLVLAYCWVRRGPGPKVCLQFLRAERLRRRGIPPGRAGLRQEGKPVWDHRQRRGIQPGLLFRHMRCRIQAHSRWQGDGPPYLMCAERLHRCGETHRGAGPRSGGGLLSDDLLTRGLRIRGRVQAHSQRQVYGPSQLLCADQLRRWEVPLCQAGLRPEGQPVWDDLLWRGLRRKLRRRRVWRRIQGHFQRQGDSPLQFLRASATFLAENPSGVAGMAVSYVDALSLPKVRGQRKPLSALVAAGAPKEWAELRTGSGQPAQTACFHVVNLHIDTQCECHQSFWTGALATLMTGTHLSLDNRVQLEDIRLRWHRRTAVKRSSAPPFDWKDCPEFQGARP